jgi:hypothetical protein
VAATLAIAVGRRVGNASLKKRSNKNMSELTDLTDEILSFCDKVLGVNSPVFGLWRDDENLPVPVLDPAEALRAIAALNRLVNQTKGALYTILDLTQGELSHPKAVNV